MYTVWTDSQYVPCLTSLSAPGQEAQILDDPSTFAKWRERLKEEITFNQLEFPRHRFPGHNIVPESGVKLVCRKGIGGDTEMVDRDIDERRVRDTATSKERVDNLGRRGQNQIEANVRGNAAAGRYAC